MKILPGALLVLLMLPAGAALSAPATPLDAEKKAEIEKMLQLTHTMDIFPRLSSAITTQLTQALKQRAPSIKAKELDAITADIQKMLTAHKADFVSSLAGVYENRFTTAELRELNTFYATPTGQKLIREMPAISQESANAGMKWSMGLKAEIESIMQKRLQKQDLATPGDAAGK